MLRSVLLFLILATASAFVVPTKIPVRAAVRDECRVAPPKAFIG